MNFSIFWAIISQLRHAIIHNQNIIKKEKIVKSKHHIKTVEHFVKLKPINENEFEIILDYTKFDELINSIAEFAFQIFKILSIQEGLPWKKE